MKAEIIKLGLMERLLKVHDLAALYRMEDLIIQAELEYWAEESLEAIDKGEVLSLDEFRKENRQWAKKKYIK